MLRLQALIELAGNARLVLAPARLELLEGKRPVALAVALDDDHVMDLGKPAALLPHFRQLLLILDEDHHHPRVLEDELALLRGVRLVDGDGDRAGERGSQVGDRPLDARAREDGNHLSLPHAERDQTPGGFFALPGQLRPGHVQPPAGDLAPRGGALRIGAGALAEELCDRLDVGELAALLLHRADVALCCCHGRSPTAPCWAVRALRSSSAPSSSCAAPPAGPRRVAR